MVSYLTRTCFFRFTLTLTPFRFPAFHITLFHAFFLMDSSPRFSPRRFPLASTSWLSVPSLPLSFSLSPFPSPSTFFLSLSLFLVLLPLPLPFSPSLSSVRASRSFPSPLSQHGASDHKTRMIIHAFTRSASNYRPISHLLSLRRGGCDHARGRQQVL